MPSLRDPQLADRLPSRPDLVLPALATDLRHLSTTMRPADLLTFSLDDSEFTLGRHEIAGLAMLFEEWDLDPDTRAVAIARARGYLCTATLAPSSP